MTRYQYQSVPQADNNDGLDSAKRVQELQAEGYVLDGESNGAWQLRRELSAEEVLAAEVGEREAAALIAGGVPDLETAQATPDATLAGLDGVGPKTVEKVRRSRGDASPASAADDSAG